MEYDSTSAIAPPGERGRRTLLVEQASPEADDVVTVRLVDPTGDSLPTWSPGAHLDMYLPNGLIRQYSLCGDQDDHEAYTVSVRLDGLSRGGSRFLHGDIVGHTIDVIGPRNHFRLVDAPGYVFIAGGIGITPILSMIRKATRDGSPWRLHYGGRSVSSMPFLEALRLLGSSRVEVTPEDTQGMIDLDVVIDNVPDGHVVYCCGPDGMLRAVEERCSRALPAGSLHIERFAASSVPKPESQPGVSGGSFEVELRRSGVIAMVPPGRTILDVVRDFVDDAPSSCEEGFCGTCETRVLEGVPEHHDSVLTDEEREDGETMMICVGRAKTPRLVLDL